MQRPADFLGKSSRGNAYATLPRLISPDCHQSRRGEEETGYDNGVDSRRRQWCGGGKFAIGDSMIRHVANFPKIGAFPAVDRSSPLDGGGGWVGLSEQFASAEQGERCDRYQDNL